MFKENKFVYKMGENISDGSSSNSHSFRFKEMFAKLFNASPDKKAEVQARINDGEKKTDLTVHLNEANAKGATDQFLAYRNGVDKSAQGKILKPSDISQKQVTSIVGRMKVDQMTRLAYRDRDNKALTYEEFVKTPEGNSANVDAVAFVNSIDPKQLPILNIDDMEKKFIAYKASKNNGVVVAQRDVN